MNIMNPFSHGTDWKNVKLLLDKKLKWQVFKFKFLNTKTNSSYTD